MIYIASDHRGYKLKNQIVKYLERRNFSLQDLGTDNPDSSVDYPDFAHILAKKMLNNDNDFGILICASGIGISIAANRHSHIRAARCIDSSDCKAARTHNNANVLALSADKAGEDIENMLLSFLNSKFEGGRHQRRINKINKT